MWQFKYEYLGNIFSFYSKYVISNSFFYRGVLNGTLAYGGNVKLSSKNWYNEISREFVV